MAYVVANGLLYLQIRLSNISLELSIPSFPLKSYIALFYTLRLDRIKLSWISQRLGVECLAFSRTTTVADRCMIYNEKNRKDKTNKLPADHEISFLLGHTQFDEISLTK